MTIQKKDVETASPEVDTQDFETATETLHPPALQLQAEKGQQEDMGGEKEREDEGPFQFVLASPADNPLTESTRLFGTDIIQGKGIAEPFKMPIVQKKESIQLSDKSAEKPSFKL
ncbi:hypothetical protein [Portibacter marinus]|uniref:hypothetical protein n=1 Tax=Portibacter marinus TaxID=2898660 RepID=UPI001F38306F|nr:hypothetical protein [Portibacter marinus]